MHTYKHQGLRACIRMYIRKCTCYIQETVYIHILKNVYMGGRLLEGRVRCEEESRVRFELDLPEGTSPPDAPLPCKARPPRLPGNIE